MGRRRRPWLLPLSTTEPRRRGRPSPEETTNMASVNAIYKCSECGAMFEAIVPCECETCELNCCGTPLELLEANSVDAATEKHVPVIEKTDCGWKVTVGSVAHPMTEEHYIQFIELIACSKVYRKALKPGDEPSACFKVCAESVAAREHCNLHGLWQAEA